MVNDQEMIKGVNKSVTITSHGADSAGFGVSTLVEYSI